MAARYRALVEQIPAITYTQVEDPSSPTGFRDVYISPQTLPLLGYTAEEWQADPELWIRATHPADRDMVVEEDRRAARSSDRFRSEYRMVARDGHVVWFRDEAVLVEDPESGLRLWQGVMLDVTDEKIARREHRAAEARYQALVEQVPAIVYLAELGSEGSWLYVSPQIERILGYTAHEWLVHPNPFGKFVHPEDLPAALEAEEVAGQRDDHFRIEYRIKARDGRWVWILDEGVIIRDDEGNPLFIQGLMSDATERKRAEELLRGAYEREREAAEQLRSLDALKGTLLHTLSHDLKNPMTAIMTAAMTLDRMPDMPEPERADMLAAMISRVRKMDRLLTDLLNLDRLDRGIVEPDRTPVDLAELVRGVIGEMEIPADRALEVAATPVVVPVDGPKAERIVENLLANAVAHTPPGTPIRVVVGPERDGAIVIVEDHGPGVPEAARASIFEPFRRGPRTTVQGTGIGLSLVARFAELHGGRAWVEDRAGGGASFRVFFPGLV